MQHNTQVPVGKHNNRQHASPHHEVATDVKQMPIRPIIIIIIIIIMYMRQRSNFLHFQVKEISDPVLDVDLTLHSQMAVNQVFYFIFIDVYQFRRPILSKNYINPTEKIL